MWGIGTDIHRPQRCEGGFTLLEVMIAVAILAIVLVSVFRMQGQSVSMAAAAQFDTSAPLLAQEKLAGIVSTGNYERFDESGDFGDKFPQYRWQVVIEDALPEELGDLARIFKKIEVKVTYGNQERSYLLRSYRFTR